MLRVLLIPGLHLVPAAIGMAALQAPLAQRWNDEPSDAQAQAPSSVHAPTWVPAAPPVVVGVFALVVAVPVAAEDDAAAAVVVAELEPAPAELEEATTAVDRVVGVAAAPLEAGTVKKTPPVLEEVSSPIGITVRMLLGLGVE